MSKPKVIRHMGREDEKVFAAFIFSPEGQSYTAWEFDVLVGDPEMPGPFYPQSQRRMAAYTNALKIDAIGWFYNSPTIIECKPSAGLSAIGQIVSYRQWYRTIHMQDCAGLILTSHMSRQCQTTALWNDIRVIILPPANEYQVLRARYYVEPLIREKSVLPQVIAARE